MTQSVRLSERRRRERLTSEDVRERLLDAGRQLVADVGLAPSLTDLSFEAVIETADVNRASAYRVYENKIDFYDDLMVSLVEPTGWLGSASFDKDTVLKAATVLQDHWGLLTEGDQNARRSVVLEACRVGAERNFAYLTDSPLWRSYAALATTIRALPESLRGRVRESLDACEYRFTTTMALFYQELSTYCGFRLRSSDIQWTHVAVAGSATMEGMAVTHQIAVVDGEPAGRLGPVATAQLPGPKTVAGQQDWSLAALAFTSVFESFIEYLPEGEFTPRPKEDFLALLEFVESADPVAVQDFAMESEAL